MLQSEKNESPFVTTNMFRKLSHNGFYSAEIRSDSSVFLVPCICIN